MEISKKTQDQVAGDYSVQNQTQIENQNNNYYIQNIFYPEGSGTNESNQQLNQPIQEEIDKILINAKKTNLWKNTLGLVNDDVAPLRDSYLKARDNAKYLLEKIKRNTPHLLVNDIASADNSWRVANTIIGDEYKINPLEGYVLGMAFLIKETSLLYEALGGKDKVRDTIEWKDVYYEGSADNVSEEYKECCDFRAIRLLYAKEAEKILSEEFKKDDGTGFYMIDEPNYRDNYGERIGKIAASSRWDFDRMARELKDQFNPVGDDEPSDWIINEKKLACILRCVDAGHLDGKNVPDNEQFYRSLLVNGVTVEDWREKNHLGRLAASSARAELLTIDSNKPYKKDEFAHWNIAFELIRHLDEELKRSNDLLNRSNLWGFPYNGVFGANSKEELETIVKTKDWKPCDVFVHTSNVKALIENLGGSKLYGEENLLLVALRELIQNARDAIQARRTLNGDPEYGRITIRLKEDGESRWIEVEDNGIGMSEDCIKHHLLDFGSSYWKSYLSRSEHPGLIGKGFSSVGHFGIGFYSVFMVAKKVEVITRRFTAGSDAIKVEFPEGLTLSPIISNQKLDPSVSTIVRFEIIDKNLLEYWFRTLYEYIISFEDALPMVVAGLDVDVYYNYECIHTNVKSPLFDKRKWLRSLFLDTPINVNVLADNLEYIFDERNELRGLVLSPEWVEKIKYPDKVDTELIPCFQTIGGLSTSFIWPGLNYNVYRGYLGYLDGSADSISRNNMKIDAPLKTPLQKWSKEKYRACYNNIIDSVDTTVSYTELIAFCDLVDDVINDNTTLLYQKYKNDNNHCYLWTRDIVGLAKIHKHIFWGTQYNTGHIGSLGESELINLNRLVDSALDKDRAIRHYMKDHNQRQFLQLLFDVNYLPISNYDQIIEKYVRMIKLHPFQDGNQRAIGIWINLMLDQQRKEMIDWRKVDHKILSDLMSKDDNYKQVADYLEQFLSSTYLDEMCASANDQS